MSPAELCALFDQLGIAYERHEHAPVFTCDEAVVAIPASDAVQTKNPFLGVAPGSVTVFGLVNGAAHAVELYVDRDVWNTARWRCHPLVNTETVVMDRAGIERFFEHTGHTPTIVSVENRSTT